MPIGCDWNVAKNACVQTIQPEQCLICAWDKTSGCVELEYSCVCFMEMAECNSHISHWGQCTWDDSDGCTLHVTRFEIGSRLHSLFMFIQEQTLLFVLLLCAAVIFLIGLHCVGKMIGAAIGNIWRHIIKKGARKEAREPQAIQALDLV